MNIDQLINNISDIKSTTQPPYVAGKALRKSLEEKCSGYRATTDGDGIDTIFYDGIDGLRHVAIIALEYSSERGVVHPLDSFFGTINPDKTLNEITVTE